jgi:hypothetical protein
MSVAVLAPEKKGILDLMSTPIGAFDPPAFVPADAASVTRLSFDFPRLFDAIRAMLASFPEELRSQAAPSVEVARDMSQQALAQMGPAVTIVGMVEQPLAKDSAKTTFAIDLKEQEAVSSTIAAIGEKFPGMVEPHEFEGNQTYTLVGLGEITLGVGFNRLFLGNEKAVQGAMRLAGRSEGGIAQSARFKDATRTLTPGAVAYMWSDVEQELRWSYWSLQNQSRLFDEQLAAAGVEPEQRAEYLKRYKEREPKWASKLPPIDRLLPHLGDTAGELRATPDGFRGRIMMVRPLEAR